MDVFESKFCNYVNIDDGLVLERYVRFWRIKGCFIYRWEILIILFLCLYSFRFVGDLVNEFVLKNVGGKFL